MRDIFVNIDSIDKRQRALCSTSESNCQWLYDIAIESLKENKSTFNNDASLFFLRCTNHDNANKHYKRCLSLIEKAKGQEQTYLALENTFIRDIVPCIENLNNLKGNLDRYALGETFNTEVSKAIKEYKVCDRILSNGDKLNKRFDFNGYIEQNKNQPLDETVSFFCSMIDTYNIPPYAKMNIIFEEMNYLLQKNYIDYSGGDLVKLVTEYFLFRESDIKESDYNEYKKVLKENYTINDDSIKTVAYFTEALFENTEEVEKIINAFKADEAKSESKLKAMISKVFTKDPESILDGTTDLLSCIRTVIVFGTFIVPPLGIITLLVSKYLEMDLNRKQISKLITYFEHERDKVEKKLEDADMDEYDELSKYYDAIEKSIDKFEMYRDNLYTDTNIEEIIGIAKESGITMNLQEFKIFKFHNLIRATIEIGKFLDRKGNKLGSDIRSMAKKIFKPEKIKKWFKETSSIDDDSICEYITEDGRFDICIEAYSVDEISTVMHELCNDLCKYINNNIITYGSTMRCYYEVKGDTYEIRLADKTDIILTESQYEKVTSCFMEEELYYLEMLNDVENSIDIIESSNISSLLNDLRSDYMYMDGNALSIVAEAAKYTNNIIPYEDIKIIVEQYDSEISDDYINTSNIKNSVSSWEHTNYPVTIVAESCAIIREVLEATATKSKLINKNNKATSNKDNTSNNSFAAGIDTIKLALQALKGKAQNLSAKEKEASKNLDATASHYINAVKQFMSNDRREAIIKGSIIPSFSKCIKYAIGLAGLAIIDPSHIILPLITLTGSLALSKKNNKKERALLLDEIEIELKIVEKEIGIAENDNNIKRMRELMAFQKKLQRESQRIRYNIKIGQDMPNAGGDD